MSTFSPYSVHTHGDLDERIEAFAAKAAFRHTDLVEPLPEGSIPVRPVELPPPPPPPPSTPHPEDVTSAATPAFSCHTESRASLGTDTVSTSAPCKCQYHHVDALVWYYVAQVVYCRT